MISSAVWGSPASGAGEEVGVPVSVVGFERAPELGGLWVFRDGADGKLRSAPPDTLLCHGLRTNTDKRAMELPDFPMPREWPAFLSHWQCAEYLTAFAA
eukprot:gene12706-14732_t